MNGTEIAYTRCGDKLVLDRGKRAGRNYLIAHGFRQCQNPTYMENCSMYAHYNRFIRGWIMEWKGARHENA